MSTEKKTFTRAELEVVRFEKNDVIATSNQVQSVIVSGPGPMIEEEEENE